MRILRDHLLKEFMSPFFFCLSLLLFVFLLGRGFLQMADLVLNKDVDALLVLKLLLVSLPFMLVFVIPMAVLVASLLTFGKLSFDNEITALRASGVSLLKLVTPITTIVFVLCLISLILSDQVASMSHFTYRRLLMQIGIDSPSAALEEGTFIKKFKNFIIFIYEIDGKKLKGIRIYQPQEGKPVRTIIAQRGELITVPEENVIKLRLVHGTSDEPDPKDPSKLYKLNFKTYDLPLNMSGLDNPKDISKKPKDMTVRELKTEIEKLGETGIKATYELSAEIHHKFALAFSSLAFLFIGIPLGITTRRGDKSVNFGISLAVMTLYWVLLIAGRAVAEKNLIPPFIALQFGNFVLGGLGVYLFTRLVRN
jgi:lipopolysaccharide export system permease protein